MLGSVSFSKRGFYFLVTFMAIVIFVLLILFAENTSYWYGLVLICIVLQSKFKISSSSLFPIIAVLTLTEYYFLFLGKRVYLCELIYFPLLINYFLTDFLWRRLSSTNRIVVLLVLSILIFQVFNFLINRDITSSFYRFRSLALPLFLVGMVDGYVKNKNDLKKAIKLILFISLISTIIVYLQFFTGDYYILQRHLDLTTEDINFIGGYLSSTEDSFLFSLIGLHIKGPMPPVGLNYFKFGFSEKIIVPISILFAFYRFETTRKRNRYLVLFLLLLMATLLTGSRSVLLTFLVVLLVIYLNHKKKLRWNFILFVIISFFVVTYLIGPFLNIINLEEFGTLASRMFYMDDFFKFVQKYPGVLFAGSSPENFLNQTGAGQPPHHFFAFGIVCDGIVVTFLLFYFVYHLLKYTRHFRTSDRELAAIGYGLWASLFGFVFIYGQTSYLTWSTPHNMFYSIIVGLLISAYRIDKQHQSLYRIGDNAGKEINDSA